MRASLLEIAACSRGGSRVALQKLGDVTGGVLNEKHACCCTLCLDLGRGLACCDTEHRSVASHHRGRQGIRSALLTATLSTSTSLSAVCAHASSLRRRWLPRLWLRLRLSRRPVTATTTAVATDTPMPTPKVGTIHRTDTGCGERPSLKRLANVC
jgi:hypothetical protein